VPSLLPLVVHLKLLRDPELRLEGVFDGVNNVTRLLGSSPMKKLAAP
jgi:hypothetical protein